MKERSKPKGLRPPSVEKRGRQEKQSGGNGFLAGLLFWAGEIVRIQRWRIRGGGRYTRIGFLRYTSRNAAQCLAWTCIRAANSAGTPLHNSAAAPLFRPVRPSRQRCNGYAAGCILRRQVCGVAQAAGPEAGLHPAGRLARRFGAYTRFRKAPGASQGVQKRPGGPRRVFLPLRAREDTCGPVSPGALSWTARVVRGRFAIPSRPAFFLQSPSRRGLARHTL